VFPTWSTNNEDSFLADVVRIRIYINFAGIEATTYTNRDPLGHWERRLEASLSQEDAKLCPPTTLPPQQIAALHLCVERGPGRGRGELLCTWRKQSKVFRK